LLILFKQGLSLSHSKVTVLKVNLDHEEDKLGTDEFSERSVSILMRSQFYILSGEWLWDLSSNKVFTSDVILSSPIELKGIKT